MGTIATTPTSTRTRWPHRIVAFFFIIYGLTAGGILALSISQNPVLQPFTLLAYLNTYGILMPIFVIGSALFLIWIGFRLSMMIMDAAHWARLVLLWSLVGTLVIITQIILTRAGGVITTTDRAILIDMLLQIGALLTFAVVCGGLIYWFNQHMDDYRGEIRLSSQTARIAWTLMLPSVAILVLVAARPLEQTFIISLTDRRFASGQEVNFIGFSNYERLLGMRIDRSPCEMDDDGECVTRIVEVETTSVVDLLIDVEQVREIIEALAAGELIRGVPRMLSPDDLAELVAIDDGTDNFINALVETPNGLNQIRFILALSLERGRIVSIDDVSEGVAQAVVTSTREETRIVYKSPSDFVEGYRAQGFSRVAEYFVFGNRYVLSARDADFIRAINNTLIFTVASVSLELLLGLFFALVVNSRFRGRGLMRTAMLVPWAIPTVVSARLWETMLIDRGAGLINASLLQFGLIDSPQAWLANTSLQLPAMVAIDVWKTTPFMALILLAGLQVIPEELYEAAEVDGASKLRQLLSITLPLLRPIILVGLIFRTLDALRVFDVFQVLLGRQKLTMATYNYEMLINNQRFGYASAIGVVIFVLIFVFTAIYVAAMNRGNQT